jgi:hypothetical protein
MEIALKNSSEVENPFETIESAREFIAMFSEMISEAKLEVEEHLQQELGAESERSRDALRIAHYNLVKLEAHMNSSRRIVNHLRSLRKLLFNERPSVVQSAPILPEVVAPTVDQVVHPRFKSAPAKATQLARVAAASHANR